MKTARTLQSLCLGFTFCAIISLGLCEQDIEITHISPTQERGIGEEVELNCTVQNPQSYSVLWFKVGNGLSADLLTHGTQKIIPEKRFSVTLYNGTSPTYSLKITNLTESDTGNYKCEIVLALNKKISSLVEIQIKRAPKICSNISTMYEVKEHNNKNLTCCADGFPRPTASWKRENDALLPNGDFELTDSVLKITNAHRDDRGIYYCIAKTFVASFNEARQAITLKVQFAPVVEAVRPRVGQTLGYDIDLECKVEAYPVPTVTWYRGSNQLGEPRKLNGNSRDEYIATYNVRSISSSDYGEYVCKAQNEYGEAQTKVELFETILPVCSGGSC